MSEPKEYDQTIDLDPENVLGDSRVALRVTHGPHVNRRWVFDRKTVVTIGRASPSNLRLPKEPALSKVHCELRIDPPHIRIVDLASTNGTLVNDAPLAEAELQHGDSFGIGDTRIAVECEFVNHPNTVVLDAALPNPAPKVRNEKIPSSQVAPSTMPEVPEVERTRFAKAISKRDVHVAGEAATRENKSRDKQNAKKVPVPKSQDAFRAKQTSKETPPPTDHVVANVSAKSQPKGVDETELVQGSRTIHVYDVFEQIGQGGMAVVFRGAHRKSGEAVAIKVVNGAMASSDKMLKLFVREASVLSQLRHMRIVRCIEFGLYEQQPYIVMEYIPTIDLLSLLAKQSQALRIKTACWVASRVLQGLDYAHKQGIVHRDVKPANILAYREAHRLQVKLGDFGLAKCYEDAGLSAMTDDLSVRGTLAYMAPEQLRDAKTARPPVDIFATGACLYRMLVGKHPTMTSQGAIYSQQECEAAGLPEALASVLAKAMQHDPKKRYKIAPEFEHALYPFHQRP